MTFRIVAVSDAHGYLKELREELERSVGLDRPPDLMVFTGDMIDRSLQTPRLERFFGELRGFFSGPILAVPGNHEAQRTGARMALPLYLDRFARPFRLYGVEFLLDRYAEVEVGQARPIRVAGLSWDPIFGRAVSEATAHSASNAIIDKLGIPEGVRPDLLLHHAPPRGILDNARQRGIADERRSIGSAVISNVVDTLCPTASVFGHCHESAGVQQICDTLFVNACAFQTRRGFAGIPMTVSEFELDLNSLG